MNLVDCTYTKQMFSREASKALELQGELTASDLDVLLKHLARDKGAVIYDNEVRDGRSSILIMLIYRTGCEV